MHATLQIQINLRDAEYPFYKPIKLDSLRHLLDGHLQRLFGEPPALPTDDDILHAWEADQSLRFGDGNGSRLHELDEGAFKLARKTAQEQYDASKLHFVDDFSQHLDVMLDALKSQRL